MSSKLFSLCLIMTLSVCGCRTTTRVPLCEEILETPWEGGLRVGQEEVRGARQFFLEFLATPGERVIGDVPANARLELAYHRGGQFEGSFFRPGTLAQFQLEPGFKKLSFELSPEEDPHIFICHYEGQKTYFTMHVFASRRIDWPPPLPKKTFHGEFHEELNEIVMDTYKEIMATHNQAIDSDKK